MMRNEMTMKWDFGESRSAQVQSLDQLSHEALGTKVPNVRKHLASTSDPIPVAVSGSSSGF